MTSFGWKRKVGQKVSRSASTAFEQEAADDEDEAIKTGDVDWLTLAPKRRVISLEDAISKSHRLKQEGSTLAEAERYWEAICKWDDALKYTPDDAKLYELKAQCYMCLNEVNPAVNAAGKAVDLEPLWSVAHQTLGRAQLGLGEVRMAIVSFSRCLHLNPADMEVWEKDLHWAFELWKKSQQTESELEKVKESQMLAKESKIVELSSEGNQDWKIKPVHQWSEVNTETDDGTDDKSEQCNSQKTLKSLPANFVHMRY